jgi:CRP/FNR family cyclic AMP-dependent transcriptional regulator
LQISQEAIGYLCSVSRQRANQALPLPERAGLIKLGYCGLNVLDLPSLRNFSPARKTLPEPYRRFRCR